MILDVSRTRLQFPMQVELIEIIIWTHVNWIVFLFIRETIENTNVKPGKWTATKSTQQFRWNGDDKKKKISRRAMRKNKNNKQTSLTSKSHTSLFLTMSENDPQTFLKRSLSTIKSKYFIFSIVRHKHISLIHCWILGLFFSSNKQWMNPTSWSSSPVFLPVAPLHQFLCDAEPSCQHPTAF